MKKKVTKIKHVNFVPFDRYGEPIANLYWHNISFDKETGHGSYILKFDTGGESLPHEHLGFEEFFVLDGNLKDSDNSVYVPGDFVTFEPGSKHFSVSDGGCMLLVFMRGKNRPLE